MLARLRQRTGAIVSNSMAKAICSSTASAILRSALRRCRARGGRQRKEPIDELVLEAAQRRAILLRHPIAAGIEAFAQGLQLLQVCLGNADPVARERTEELCQLMQVRRRLLGALIDECQAQSRRVEFDEVADAAEGARSRPWCTRAEANARRMRTRVSALTGRMGRRLVAEIGSGLIAADAIASMSAFRDAGKAAHRGILLAAMRDADAEGRPMAITRPGPVPRPAGIEICLARPAPAAEVRGPARSAQTWLDRRGPAQCSAASSSREGQQRDLEGAIGSGASRRSHAGESGSPERPGSRGTPELDGLEHERADVGPAPTRDAVPRRRDPFEKPAHRGQVAQQDSGRLSSLAKVRRAEAMSCCWRGVSACERVTTQRTSSSVVGRHRAIEPPAPSRDPVEYAMVCLVMTQDDMA